mmetsp:Transcript_148582/g.413968  ORF Transcript_148582/g.413968 Transcript_148582/m.413968 type:complete len:362 (+) Transcript_148582:435-1520(+)
MRRARVPARGLPRRVGRRHRPTTRIGTSSANIALGVAQAVALAYVLYLLCLRAVAQVEPVHLLAEHPLGIGSQRRGRHRWSTHCNSCLDHVGLHVEQELLLRTQYAPRSTDAVPPNKGPCRKLVVLHRVKPDKRTRPTKASLAVNSNCARLILSNVQELGNDISGRAAPIQEVQVDVLDLVIYEAPSLVLFFVQADDEADSCLPEDRHVVLRRESRKPIRIRWRRARPSEGQELVRDDPVHVSVFDLLEEVIRLNVKPVPIKPPVSDALLQSLQAVHYCEVECANAACGIAEGKEWRIDSREWLISHVGRLAQSNHLVCTDQTCRICPLLGIVGTIVDNALLCQRRIHNLSLEHLAIPVYH